MSTNNEYKSATIVILRVKLEYLKFTAQIMEHHKVCKWCHNSR